MKKGGDERDLRGMDSALDNQDRTILIQNKNTTPKGGAEMKKLLFILLACFISVSIVSLGNAQEACDGLEGAEYGLCNAYCNAHDCVAMEEATGESCAMLRKNWAKHTDVPYFPCDIIACAQCGDPDPCNQQGTIGVCEEIPAFECPESALPVGQYDCDVVTIPADVAPGCSQIPPQWGLIPDCQYTGPAFVCNFFIGGVLVDKCPAPPSCLTECSADEDCLTDNEFGYGYICVDEQCAPDCECDGDVCVPN